MISPSLWCHHCGKKASHFPSDCYPLHERNDFC
jgi:hypothetical protein